MLTYGLLGRRHAEHIRNEREQLKRRHAAECSFRDPTGLFSTDLRRWRSGQANLKTGIIYFEPYGGGCLQLRARRLKPIRIPVAAVEDRRRQPKGLERLRVAGEIVNIDTGEGVVEWALQPGVADWAIDRARPVPRTESPAD